MHLKITPAQIIIALPVPKPKGASFSCSAFLLSSLHDPKSKTDLTHQKGNLPPLSFLPFLSDFITNSPLGLNSFSWGTRREEDGYTAATTTSFFLLCLCPPHCLRRPNRKKEEEEEGRRRVWAAAENPKDKHGFQHEHSTPLFLAC